MDIVASFIGFIPCAISVIWFFEIFHKRNMPFGIIGCLSFFLFGISLIGFLKGAFSGNVVLPLIFLLCITGILALLFFFLWKKKD